MKLYRVRVEFDVMVVAESPWAAMDRAWRTKPEPDATITACPATSAADLFGRAETIPYLTDEAARIPDEHERTCAEWLDYLASLPPSDAGETEE